MTKKQRELNEDLRIYKSWEKKVVEDRVEEAKSKIKEKGFSEENSCDLIEAIVKNSMKEKKEGELVYTQQDIMDEFSTFFVAGVDTTSNYLSMMICLIGQHPEVEKKLREEIDTYMKDDDYSFENLKKFTYLECIQKEVTRYYGPVNGIFSRICVKDDFLKGIPIKKNTMFNVQPLGTHLSEKYYKNPL